MNSVQLPLASMIEEKMLNAVDMITHRQEETGSLAGSDGGWWWLRRSSRSHDDVERGHTALITDFMVILIWTFNVHTHYHLI